MLPDDVLHHGHEAVHGVGHHARGGAQRVRQSEVGPEGQRHAVEQEERARSSVQLPGRRCLRGRRHLGAQRAVDDLLGHIAHASPVLHGRLLDER
jgi:hypothetical protein